MGRKRNFSTFVSLFVEKEKKRKEKYSFSRKKNLSKAMQEIFVRKLEGNRLSTYFRAIILELSTMGKTFNL
jgi:hypothetical protein